MIIDYRKLYLLGWGIVVLCLLAACMQQPRTPSEAVAQSYVLTTDAVEAIGQAYQSGIIDVDRKDALLDEAIAVRHTIHAAEIAIAAGEDPEDALLAAHLALQALLTALQNMEADR